MRERPRGWVFMALAASIVGVSLLIWAALISGSQCAYDGDLGACTDNGEIRGTLAMFGLALLIGASLLGAYLRRARQGAGQPAP